MVLGQIFAQRDQEARLVKEYGGKDALEKQQKAVRAANRGNLKGAADWMRSALEASKKGGHPYGAPALKRELSQLLGAAGVAVVNDKGQNASVADFVSAIDMLEEAVRLDPQNTQAAGSLNMLRQIRERMMGMLKR
jgi:hypothetical protein